MVTLPNSTTAAEAPTQVIELVEYQPRHDWEQARRSTFPPSMTARFKMLEQRDARRAGAR